MGPYSTFGTSEGFSCLLQREISSSTKMVVLILLSYCLAVQCLDNPTCTDLKNFPQILRDKRQTLDILNVSSETGLLGCVQHCMTVNGCQTVSFDTNSGTCYKHTEDGIRNPHLLKAQPSFLITAVKDWPRMSDLMKTSPDFTNEETGSIESETSTKKTYDRIPAVVAQEMADVAGFLAWYASNTLKGNNGHASRDAKDATLHKNKFKQLSPFSDLYNSLFIRMANATAWSTAHVKLGDKAKSDNLSKLVNDLHNDFLKTGEVTALLASDLRELCWSKGWEASNTRAGPFHTIDAFNARTKANGILKKISL